MQEYISEISEGCNKTVRIELLVQFVFFFLQETQKSLFLVQLHVKVLAREITITLRFEILALHMQLQVLDTVF